PARSGYRSLTRNGRKSARTDSLRTNRVRRFGRRRSGSRRTRRGGGFDQGRQFAAILANRGYRVIAVSRFGYLRTPLPADASAEAQARAHACLLDALHIRRAAIIGASAGAPSSILFALQYPERVSALGLLVPAAYVPRPGNESPLRT